MAIAPHKAASLEAELEKAGVAYSIVGRLTEGSKINVLKK